MAPDRSQSQFNLTPPPIAPALIPQIGNRPMTLQEELEQKKNRGNSVFQPPPPPLPNLINNSNNQPAPPSLSNLIPPQRQDRPDSLIPP